jgi:hypothetical protein
MASCIPASFFEDKKKAGGKGEQGEKRECASSSDRGKKRKRRSVVFLVLGEQERERAHFFLCLPLSIEGLLPFFSSE